VTRSAALSILLSVLLFVLLLVLAFVPRDDRTAAQPDPPAAEHSDSGAAVHIAAPVVLPPPPPPPTPAARPVPSVRVAEPQPEVRQENAEEPEERAPVRPIDKDIVAEGRVLLHLIAEGKGPSIEIAWPDSAPERADLYRRLTRCHGLETVLVGDGGALYADDGANGKAWQFNRDAFSPFMRLVSGPLAPAEQDLVRAIRGRHGVTGAVARILPRIVDAGIVGSLFQLSGKGVGEQVSISARYGFDRAGVLVDDIAVDGTPVAGVLRVPVIDDRCAYRLGAL